MKIIRTMLFGFVLLIADSAKAQLTLENSTVLESLDSTLRVEQIYIGFLPETLLDIYPDSSRNASISASLRIGAAAALDLSRGFSFHTMGMYEAGSKESKVVTEVFAKYNYRAYDLSVGYMATPSTLLRPRPLTGDGQFESETAATLPEHALGTTLSFKHKGNEILFEANVGAFLRDDMPEYHFTVSCIDEKVFVGAMTIYYSAYNRAFGTAGKMQVYLLPQVRTDIMYTVRTATKDPREFGEKGTTYAYGAVSFGKDFLHTFYCDYGKEQTYTTPKLKGAIENQSRLEVGYTRVFTTKHMKVMLGGGYRRDERSAVFYSMFYL